MADSDPLSLGANPLIADEARLHILLDAMYVEIHKLLGWAPPPRRSNPLRPFRRSTGPDRTISGSALVSADDILAGAAADLLATEPADVRETWEQLGMTIAQNKTKDALKSAGRGLRATPTRRALHLVSGNERAARSSEAAEDAPELFDTVVDPDPARGPAEAYEAASSANEVRRLARELLNPRDEKVFVTLHFHLATRRELATEFEISTQAVGDAYRKAQKTIWAHPQNPYRTHQEEQDNARGA